MIVSVLVSSASVDASREKSSDSFWGVTIFTRGFFYSYFFRNFYSRLFVHEYFRSKLFCFWFFLLFMTFYLVLCCLMTVFRNCFIVIIIIYCFSVAFSVWHSQHFHVSSFRSCSLLFVTLMVRLLFLWLAFKSWLYCFVIPCTIFLVSSLLTNFTPYSFSSLLLFCVLLLISSIPELMLQKPKDKTEFTFFFSFHQKETFSIFEFHKAFSFISRAGIKDTRFLFFFFFLL